MNLHDAERVYHRTYISDKNAQPLLGKISGTLEISIFIASIILAVVGFYVLTKVLGFTALPSLTVGLLPLVTYATLSQFVAGKPKDYISSWLESRRLEKSRTPLLTATNDTDENN
jgi:hypothetical protein